MAGYLALRGPAPARPVLAEMGRRLAHRGPDSEGVWQDDAAGIGLVHRRLAILDLSNAGAQPMVSESGRYVISYNGEVYNHLDLRADLARAGRAPAWRGHSDTETLLALIEAHGIEGALASLRGMFAFALWDRHERRLTLARDRMGEKPLYYGRVGGLFVFASELSALRALPGFARAIDRQAVASLIRHACIPAPASIYAGISKLRPGYIATIGAAGSEPVETAWWRLVDVVAEAAPARARHRPYAELVAKTEAVLAGAVRAQTISDRPLGAFLSGGVDSSLVTALMAAARDPGEVRTYSIGFETERFDEAKAARAVAAHLGTRHTGFTVTEADALALVGELGATYSEPFADSSQIPLVLLSRLTRQDVTVALSGDGGDEMFGGYNRHVMAPGLWARASLCPQAVRRAGAGLAGRAAGAIGEGTAHRLTPLATRLGLPVTALDRLGHFAGALGGTSDLDGFYAGLIGSPDAARLCRDAGAEPELPAEAAVPLPPGLAGAERLMLMDALWYLPDDVLVKVDRAAMSASLETRAPFLDPEVVRTAWELPLAARIAGRRGKRILRDILCRHVPRELVDRPKQGFAVPIDAWLRGPLHDWAGDRLRPSPALQEAGIDTAALDALWNRHRSGRMNAGSTLWSVVMLADWHAASAHARPVPAQSG